MIHNPILKGFHPDPSIVRVGEDYYIATSTFEWWPGIHRSGTLGTDRVSAKPDFSTGSAGRGCIPGSLGTLPDL